MNILIHYYGNSSPYDHIAPIVNGHIHRNPN